MNVQICLCFNFISVIAVILPNIYNNIKFSDCCRAECKRSLKFQLTVLLTGIRVIFFLFVFLSLVGGFCGWIMNSQHSRTLCCVIPVWIFNTYECTKIYIFKSKHLHENFKLIRIGNVSFITNGASIDGVWLSVIAIYVVYNSFSSWRGK